MAIDPFGPFQDLVGQLPELVQPILVAVIGAIPFIDEAATGLGVVAGMHPLVAFTANVIGSTVAVVLVVLLGARVREAIVRRRARRSAAVQAPVLVSVGAPDEAPSSTESAITPQLEVPKEESKGKKRLSRWLVRFGVPGASVLAPLALPFAFTALFFVSAGVSKKWVILWQVIAIVLWTALVTLSATAAVAVFPRGN